MEDYQKIYRQAKEKWDGIAKPLDALGMFEDMVAKLCAVAGTTEPGDYKRRALLVLCADHGVVAEGVTQTNAGVTRIVAENIAHGCSGVNYMANQAGVDVFPVDIGMLGEPYPHKTLAPGQITDRRVQDGTANLATDPAMTAESCERAIRTGEMLVGELAAQGYEMLAIGEMGIGNTTPTSALCAALLSLSAADVTGRGAGLDDTGLARKRQVIGQALERVRAKRITDAKELLAELGGLEIAAMVGVYFGAKKYRIPVILDGAITCVAALAAMRMEPEVCDYLLASHVSEEPCGAFALEALGLAAPIAAHLCLGEGSGAMMLFPQLDMALSVYHNMGSFDDFEICAYSRDGKP